MRFSAVLIEQEGVGVKKFNGLVGRHRILPLLVMSMAISACNTKAPADLIESADGYLKKGDIKAAVIQVKDALSQNQELPRGRFLLGKIFLESGDPAAAIVELRKAQQLGYAPDETRSELARAMLAAEQYQPVIDEFANAKLSDARAIADLKTSVATAYASLNKFAEANREIDAGLAQVADYPSALLLKARFAGFERRTDDALRLTDKVLSLAPQDPQAWFQKGELLILLKQDRAGAIEAFKKAVSIRPSHTAAQSALIEALINQREFKGATEQLAAFRKVSRNAVLTNYLEARLAFASGDLKKAGAAIEAAQKTGSDAVPILELAGSIQLANGSLLKAERSFSKALSVQPDRLPVRLLLAQTEIRMGQAAKAVATLQPLVAAGNVPAAHALAGEAYLALGDLERSRSSFAAAASLDPSDPANAVKLALADQKRAGYASTVAALQKIAQTDKGTSADLALTSVQLLQKDFDAALKSLDTLEQKLPKNPLPHNLRAKVYVLRDDLPSARKSYEAALAIDPVFVPAVEGLASLDIKEKNISAARGRFEAVLKIDPNNLQSLLELARLKTAEGGAKSEVVELLSQAIRLHPAEAEPRLMLIELHLADGNSRAAQSAARDAIAALPDHPDLLDALGRSEARAGVPEQAMAAFSKLAGVEPKSPRAFMRLASLQLSANKVNLAEQNLRRALALVPDYLQAQQALARIAVNRGKPEEAIAIARTVQSQRTSETVGHDMEAEVELGRGNAGAAADVYRRALKKAPVSIFAIKLHRTLVVAGKKADADRFAVEWTAGHPRDASFIAYLGDVALSARQFEVAEQQFRKVLALEPDNAAALNNVAHILVQTGRPGGVQLAEQALKLRPDAAGVLDTLASALALDKQWPQAVEAERRALKLEPGNQLLRFNLAKLLVQSGDKQAARVELEALQKAGDAFPGQAEVARLLQTL